MRVSGHRSRFFAFVPGCPVCHPALPLHVFTAQDSSTVCSYKVPVCIAGAPLRQNLVSEKVLHNCAKKQCFHYIFFTFTLASSKMFMVVKFY